MVTATNVRKGIIYKIDFALINVLWGFINKKRLDHAYLVMLIQWSVKTLK